MESARIVPENEFAQAVIRIVQSFTLRNGVEWKPADQIAQMLESRDTAIRNECADRAVEWQKGACRGDWDKCRSCPDCERLRAAIEGTP